MVKSKKVLSWDERVEVLLDRIPRLRPVDGTGPGKRELHFDGEGWRWRDPKSKKCSQYWPNLGEIEPRLIAQMQNELSVKHGAMRCGHAGEFAMQYPVGKNLKLKPGQLLPVLVAFWETQPMECA